MKIKVLVFKNSEDGSNYIFEKIKNKILTNKKINLGIATGSTFIDVYKKLSKEYKSNNLDFSKVKFFGLDEYLNCKKSDPHSYYYFMNDLLYKHINTKDSNIFFPPSNNPKKLELNKYNEFILDNPVDIQLLGVGENGHIAFNEPPSELNSTVQIVSLDESTIKRNAKLFFDGNTNNVPKNAVSVGIKNILSSKQNIVALYGPNKSKILNKFLKNDLVSKDLPLSYLKNHKNTEIITDEYCFWNVKKIERKIFELIYKS